MSNTKCEEHPDTLSIHCWRFVVLKGLRGYVGCHEDFGDPRAYWIHLSRGACRNPEGIDRLRWDGVSWNVKEKEKDGERATSAT